LTAGVQTVKKGFLTVWWTGEQAPPPRPPHLQFSAAPVGHNRKLQGNDFSTGKWDFPHEKSLRSRRTCRRDRLHWLPDAAFLISKTPALRQGVYIQIRWAADPGNSHSHSILPFLAIPDASPACFAHRARQAQVPNPLEGFLSPRSTLVGQPGSKAPPGLYSLPGQFG
ncbi:MAG: hypothetical protein IKU34_00165, partial [Clostridia bacterium]|nr:hypothetical protein [Clostridia bacterium]